MSDIAIEVDSVWKKFHRGEFHDSLRDFIPALARRVLGRGPKRDELAEGDFWALKDVSFQVRQGEVLGIIGANGAGKSTLLKILAKILKPNRGQIRVNGRLRALIEVAAGFHPDLTGRENVYLNGSILGMKKREIDAKFDEIVEFSGISEFLDTPVKRYSSGMYARLGFAVAAHLDPEILIVDEVLAVGDAEFQKKCLGKMEDVAKGGRTILFVSHNMQAVQTLCGSGLYIDRGQVACNGSVRDVVKAYLEKARTDCVEQTWDAPETAPGNEWIRVHKLRVVQDDNQPEGLLDIDSPLSIECLYWNLKPDTHLNLSIVFFRDPDLCAFATTSVAEPNWRGRPFPAGLFRTVCRVPGRLLNDGVYRITVMFVKDASIPVFVQENALAFEVYEYQRDGRWYGKIPGAVRPELEWSTDVVCLGPFKHDAD
jgi:lipopolysaccharide transport system ATP-binding protein